jgi:protein-L-isoaspartate O-methyltransferase
VEQAAAGASPLRIAVTYALPEAPDALLSLLPEGGRLAAPVNSGAEDQLLTCWTREDGALRRRIHGPVRYVAQRSY